MSASTSEGSGAGFAAPILGIDTSAAQCAAAVVCEGRLMSRLAEDMPKGQAERLAPMIAEALQAAGLEPRVLGAIAVCTGPGNFTGVRIGVATARGLALATGSVAVGVPRLEALAAAAGPGRVLVTAAARRGRFHAQVFDVRPQLPPAPASSLATDEVAALEPLFTRARPDLVIGPAAAELATALGAEAGAAGDLAAPEDLARLAALRLGAGERPPRPAPVYVRPPDAALPSEPPPPLIGEKA